MKQSNTKKEKKNKLPRFSLLDAFIILLVIVTVVGIYFRYDMVDFLKTRQNSEKYTVTFSIENIRYTTPSYINIGDTVYLASDGEAFGTVLSESDEMTNLALNVTPASELLSVNGQLTEVFYPNNEIRVDVKGRLACSGITAENGSVLINGTTYLASGQIVSVYTETVSVNIRILDIEKTV